MTTGGWALSEGVVEGGIETECNWTGFRVRAGTTEYARRATVDRGRKTCELMA